VRDNQLREWFNDVLTGGQRATLSDDVQQSERSVGYGSSRWQAAASVSIGLSVSDIQSRCVQQ